MSLRRFLITFELLYLMRLTLNDLLEIRNAAVVCLGLTDQGFPAFRALYFHLRAVPQEVQLYLLFSHLSGDTGHRALFRASVDFVAWAIELKMLNQIPVFIKLSTKLLLLFLLGTFFARLLLVLSYLFRFW